MNDETNYNAPTLDETSYDPSTAKKNNSLEGMSAPVLDDFEYVAPVTKKDGPVGVTAPVLDEVDDYVPTHSKKDGPVGITAPVLDEVDDYVPTHSKKDGPIGVDAPLLEDFEEKKSDDVDYQSVLKGMTAEQKVAFEKLSPEKQNVVIEHIKKQLAQKKESAPPVEKEDVKAPVLDDDTYVPPVKKAEPIVPEEPIAAPILDDAPPPTEYKPKFVDEDLERAKQGAAQRAVKAQLVSNQKDEKESLRMMQELRAEKEHRDAQEGFKITIILAIVGVVSAVLFYLFASGEAFGLVYKIGGNKFGQIISKYSFYISMIVGIASLSMISGIKAFKSLASTIFFFFTIILIFPGIIMLTQKDGGFALNAILYASSILSSGYICFSLATNQKITHFFNKK